MDDMAAKFLSTLSLRRATQNPKKPNKTQRFLSTLSLRRATHGQFIPHLLPQHFYPRSPCGERPRFLLLPVRGSRISIHALLAESDASLVEMPRISAIFLSTLSLRRATHKHGQLQQGHVISIHALLAESDGETQEPKPTRQNQFLSTLSLRRATPPVREIIQWEGIFLSTLSLRRATCIVSFRRYNNTNFYPRSPCGERLEQSASYNAYMAISIHALLAESDPDPSGG